MPGSTNIARLALATMPFLGLVHVALFHASQPSISGRSGSNLLKRMNPHDTTDSTASGGNVNYNEGAVGGSTPPTATCACPAPAANSAVNTVPNAGSGAVPAPVPNYPPAPVIPATSPQVPANNLGKGDLNGSSGRLPPDNESPDVDGTQPQGSGSVDPSQGSNSGAGGLVGGGAGSVGGSALAGGGTGALNGGSSGPLSADTPINSPSPASPQVPASTQASVVPSTLESPAVPAPTMTPATQQAEEPPTTVIETSVMLTTMAGPRPTDDAKGSDGGGGADSVKVDDAGPPKLILAYNAGVELVIKGKKEAMSTAAGAKVLDPLKAKEELKIGATVASEGDAKQIYQCTIKNNADADQKGTYIYGLKSGKANTFNLSWNPTYKDLAIDCTKVAELGDGFKAEGEEGKAKPTTAQDGKGSTEESKPTKTPDET